MQRFTPGGDITVAVPFLRDGEPFVPDVANLAWYLRNQAGVPGSSTPFACTDSVAHIVVDASNNVLPTDTRFSKRFVCVTGTDAGKPFTIVVPYVLVPWQNTTVTPDEVRSFIGVDRGELGDADIDLTTAYFDTVDALGDESTLTDALASGLVAETHANNAIRMKAVSTAIPSLQLRLSQSENDGSMAIERLKGVDLEAIAERARQIFATAITALSNRVGVNRTLFIVTTPTDPVTGV